MNKSTTSQFRSLRHKKPLYRSLYRCHPSKFGDSLSVSSEDFVLWLNLDSSFNIIFSRVSYNVIRCGVLILNSTGSREGDAQDRALKNEFTFYLRIRLYWFCPQNFRKFVSYFKLNRDWSCPCKTIVLLTSSRHCLGTYLTVTLNA